jgi:hypothetical protein
MFINKNFNMKRLLVISIFATLLSCSKENDSCNCSDMVGKKFEAQVKRQNADKDFVFEDFRLNKDKTIDIWRLDDNGETFIKNAAKYELTEKNGVCNLKSTPEPKHIVTDAFFHITMTEFKNGQDFTLTTCNSFNLGLVNFIAK